MDHSQELATWVQEMFKGDPAASEAMTKALATTKEINVVVKRSEYAKTLKTAGNTDTMDVDEKGKDKANDETMIDAVEPSETPVEENTVLPAVGGQGDCAKMEM